MAENTSIQNIIGKYMHKIEQYTPQNIILKDDKIIIKDSGQVLFDIKSVPHCYDEKSPNRIKCSSFEIVDMLNPFFVYTYSTETYRPGKDNWEHDYEYVAVIKEDLSIETIKINSYYDSKKEYFQAYHNNSSLLTRHINNEELALSILLNIRTHDLDNLYISTVYQTTNIKMWGTNLYQQKDYFHLMSMYLIFNILYQEILEVVPVKLFRNFDQIAYITGEQVYNTINLSSNLIGRKIYISTFLSILKGTIVLVKGKDNLYIHIQSPQNTFSTNSVSYVLPRKVAIEIIDEVLVYERHKLT